jgi:hypothetical protein
MPSIARQYQLLGPDTRRHMTLLSPYPSVTILFDFKTLLPATDSLAIYSRMLFKAIIPIVTIKPAITPPKAKQAIRRAIISFLWVIWVFVYSSC